MNRKFFFVLAAIAMLVAVFGSYQPAWSQATVGTGSIDGAVTDPQGAVVAGAKVTITNKGTGNSKVVFTTDAGNYASGSLTAGTYEVRIEAANFKTFVTTYEVRVGTISGGDVKLELGAASSVVEVTSEAVSVQTEQSSVSGTLTADQIENLPLNGRNFLDLAQLEPGVQIQDGSNFDPTKTGFSSISFGGRFGRTARIEVDGLDVSDETVGTTTTNIPASAISEFQLAESSLDLSTELTSSGAVNVATKSGTNTYHGEGFGIFRASSQGAALPGFGTYQRNQYGGDVGGAIVPDKLFFFLDGERILQHAAAGLTFAPPFQSFDGTFSSPYSDFIGLAKLDWQITKSVHGFFRYNYFQNSLVPTFGTPSYSAFGNKDRTRNFAGGVDFNTGSFTHSFRVEYLKFINNIVDATTGGPTPLADFPVSLDFPANGLATGPSNDAPQRTFQTDHQAKYDGSKIWGSHIIRYGVAFNHIQGGGFASFFGIAPTIFDDQFTGTPYDSFLGSIVTCPGGQVGAACPLNYTPDLVFIGNGLGCSTELPAFGQQCGGNGPDNRLGLYVGDSWKVRPNLTFLFGVRYSRDTGRTDSDLDTIEEVNNYLPGFGNRVKQQNADFGPQIGLAWDPKGNGKTVIRAGVGVYYENTIFNNLYFDRPSRLASGAFLEYTPVCSSESAIPVPFADGSSQTIPGGDATCSTAIGGTLPATAVTPLLNCSGLTVAVCVRDFSNAFQAAAAANPNSANAEYLPNEIAAGEALTGGAGTLAPNFRVPRSVQINGGFQHEIRPGMVVSVDYLRNVATHYLLDIDVNHTGDAAYLNVHAAQQAIGRTEFFCGNGFTIEDTLENCPTDPLGPTDAANLAAAGTPYVPRPATISDYATNGLDSPVDLAGGVQCGGGLQASYQYACAFGGINPQIGLAGFLEPVGRSVYNAMDVKWQDNVKNPFPGVRYLNFQASYTLSRFQNDGSTSFASPGTAGAEDQDFIDTSLDNRNPGRFFGDSTLDRTHQLNMGGWATLPGGFQLGLISHFWSPLAVEPVTPASGTAAIYESDFTGSGVTENPLPIAQTSSTCGTVGGECVFTTYNVGAFGRSLSPNGLVRAINNYNGTIAGQTITPAGQALVNAGLVTEAELVALGATPQPIATSPADPAALGWLRAFDLEISYHHSFFNERLTLTPSVSIFNLFNLRNFDDPINELSGLLTGNPETINGTSNSPSNAAYRADQVGDGTGVFAFGSPRAIEWQLKFQF